MMTMIPPRANLGIAVDGGDIKGLIVAQGLLALEKQLTGDQPLIEYPGLKVLIGTSTGSIITAGIAVGMRMSDLIELYMEAGESVFPPLVPAWLPRGLRAILTGMIGMTRPSLYRADTLRELIRVYIKKFTGNPDFTLGDLRARLHPDQALIVTVMDINDRRTHFLKSYQANDANWKLWEIVLASSSVPTILPVLEKDGVSYCDGGVGSYGNPAYIAAREAIDWARYKPQDVSIFSFGTGWLDSTAYVTTHGAPSRWNILKWGMNGPFITVADTARTQSLDIIDDYMDLEHREKGMDFRRFQVLLDKNIEPFDPSKVANALMQEYGIKLGQQILNNQHALGEDSAFDPEGLRSVLERYMTSQAVGGAQQTPTPAAEQVRHA